VNGRAEAVVEALPLAAVLSGTNGAVAAFNAAAAQLFPYLRQGQPLSFAIRHPDILAAVAAAARDGGPRRLEIVERLPVERAFAVHASRVAGDGTLLVFDDMTASRNLERMRVDFIANASHELRTPLASLLGFVETLRGPARNDLAAQDRFLAIMEGQAKRMARLIDDLLSLSRIELNAHIRPTGRADLAAVVRQLADALRPLAEERGTALSLDLPAEGVEVVGDRDELLRVLENLIENAIKYGREGGRVAVRLGRRGGEVLAEVADDGPGIAAEHLPRLTERFYRVSVAASRDVGGTGLGLAIVKHILARHRGRLEIESVLGQGSTFRVVLPAAGA
jgi:two-component system, OmpR family, phosphate regulon sensor histidine kinase PhoR